MAIVVKDAMYYTSIKCWLNKALLLLGLGMLLPLLLAGQIIQPDRFEMPVTEGTSYDVVSAGKQGLFVLSSRPNSEGQQMAWHVVKLDTDFGVMWQRHYPVSISARLLATRYIGGRLYFLFAGISKEGRHLELLSFDEGTGHATSTILKNYIAFSFFDFTVTGRSAVVAGYFNYRPIAILYDLEDKIPRVLPGIYNDRSQLVQMTATQYGTLDVVLSGLGPDKRNTLFINTYGSRGALLSNIQLETDKVHRPLFGRVQQMGVNGARIVAGVYGRNNSEYSRGVFVANLNVYGEQKVKYYNYADLKNFFNYMKARREERVRNRIERRKVKDKKLRFNYRLLVHELIESQGQYVMLGEAFYPKYRNVSGNTGGIFQPVWTVNRGVYRSSLIFEGYRYTHAVLLGFDEVGNLLWDNSFEINDVLSTELEQFVHVAVKGNKVTLLYVYDDQIRTKIISGSEVLEGKEEVSLALKYMGDQVVPDKTTVAGLGNWYEQVFYTYGTQTVHNMSNEAVMGIRQVFFINKLVND